jgi:hypothetical protein
LAAKLEAERRLKEGISGHRTGLPKKLLELFAPLPLPGVLPELRKRPPKVPYTGIGQYVAGFADKGEPEYEPQPEVPRPPSPRLFKNPELAAQARFDYETRAEKCACLPACCNLVPPTYKFPELSKLRNMHMFQGGKAEQACTSLYTASSQLHKSCLLSRRTALLDIA